jgi:hypothetical protein
MLEEKPVQKDFSHKTCKMNTTVLHFEPCILGQEECNICGSNIYSICDV